MHEFLRETRYTERTLVMCSSSGSTANAVAVAFDVTCTVLKHLADIFTVVVKKKEPVNCDPRKW